MEADAEVWQSLGRPNLHLLGWVEDKPQNLVEDPKIHSGNKDPRYAG